MERHANRPLSHIEPRCSLPNGRAVERNGGDGAALALREALQVMIEPGRDRRRFGGIVGKRFGELLDWYVIAAAAAAHSIDQLVAGDCAQPWSEWQRGIPGLPLEVNGEQGFLHDILGIIEWQSGAAQTPARRRPQGRRQAREQPIVGGGIALVGGPHPIGPINFELAQTGLPRFHSFEGGLLLRVTDPKQATHRRTILNTGSRTTSPAQKKRPAEAGRPGFL